MRFVGNVPAVITFEAKRSRSVSRIAWWLILTLFPTAIMLLMRFTGAEPPRAALAGMLFVLIPLVMCMLGVFLWSTPAIASELECGSWVYLAVRPDGRAAVLLGKYVVAVGWTIPAALLGLYLALLVAPTAAPAGNDAVEFAVNVSSWRIAAALSGLSILSTMSYASVYILIGVLFPKRAMVLAVAYTVIFECVVGFVPAMMNKLTIQFRLRSLFMAWLDIPLPGPSGRGFDLSSLIADTPPLHNVLILLATTASLLLVSVIAVRTKEFARSAATSE